MDYLNYIVNGKCPTIPDHLTEDELKLIRRDLCLYTNTSVRHSNQPRYFYQGLLIRFHPDKILAKSFNNAVIYTIKYRLYYVSMLIGKCCLHFFNVACKRTTSDPPLPLITSNFNLYNLTAAIPVRITTLDALAIEGYEVALQNNLLNANLEGITEINIHLISI